MQLRWTKRTTREIGVAYVTDSDIQILQAVGYYHCEEEDFTDDEFDGEMVEVWKPKED